MTVSATDDLYRIVMYRSKKRRVRFLISDSVSKRIPCLQEALFRAAAEDRIIWPEDIVITAYDDDLPVPVQCLHIILPEWLFEKAKTAYATKPRWNERLAGARVPNDLRWYLANAIAHYLQPLQPEDKRKDCAILIDVNIMCYDGYRPIEILLRSLIIVPVVLSLFGLIFIRAWMFSKCKKAVRAKAELQREMGFHKQLLKTRRQLLALGVPEEELKRYDLKPRLTLMERGDESVSRD